MTSKSAIVFGGSRGIGAAIVKALSEDGYAVTLTYTRSAPSDLPEGVTAVQADIREPAQVAAVFDKAGEVSCVVANAGINVPPAPIADFPLERFRDLVEVNIVGAFNVLHEAAARVADGGTIIGLTTSMVRVAIPGVGPYSATKGAVECLLRSMSKELAPRGIRVNGVAPGPVDTDLFRSGKDEAAIQRSAAISPFNRVGQPEEVAEVVRFLVSDRASWVHGQIVQPNGGMV
ncbi:SDR family oxidoreductase [Actibacterium pelagium]|uniref:3-oxoacyl-ACP reductase n=1 Tax=Actibacterium pelagium TaxID=2029103 RepID=A0A917EHV5_9RHOB|nr:SDR family oxidoreductase [Actibacterium pelagium]GGE36932.1 3-oxoacyl-ACP reductase [Actibacterium pelagium]